MIYSKLRIGPVQDPLAGLAATIFFFRRSISAMYVTICLRFRRWRAGQLIAELEKLRSIGFCVDEVSTLIGRLQRQQADDVKVRRSGTIYT
jgi:hypothetical protein